MSSPMACVKHELGSGTSSSQEKATVLIADKAECIPLHWIFIEKRNHLRRPGGSEVDPLHKARLVARGGFEKGCSRTDSPAIYQEALFIVCNVVSLYRQLIRSGDAENADSQGEKPTRTLLLSQPQGGDSGRQRFTH